MGLFSKRKKEPAKSNLPMKVHPLIVVFKSRGSAGNVYLLLGHMQRGITRVFGSLMAGKPILKKETGEVIVCTKFDIKTGMAYSNVGGLRGVKGIADRNLDTTSTIVKPDNANIYNQYMDSIIVGNAWERFRNLLIL